MSCGLTALATAGAAVLAAPATILPVAPTIPENTLRLEIRLAEPLPWAPSIDGFALRRADGSRVEQPFLQQVLLAADGRWLTVYLHPGRVKTGLGAHERLGRALTAGEVITFVADWPGLAMPLTASWRVGPADVEGPKPAVWRSTVPVVRGCAPLAVELDAPVSVGSADLLAVVGPDGERVAGHGELAPDGLSYRFTPTAPWGPGEHALAVHPDLEDIAGNRTCARFDQLRASAERCLKTIYRPFRPRQ
jgi:hypothetical protein